MLYPDKHSWCQTTQIKQVVTWPQCSSQELDNNVCVGACFSYMVPHSEPSAPGDLIRPYCDSCQPLDSVWHTVNNIVAMVYPINTDMSRVSFSSFFVESLKR